MTALKMSSRQSLLSMSMGAGFLGITVRSNQVLQNMLLTHGLIGRLVADTAHVYARREFPLQLADGWDDEE